MVVETLWRLSMQAILDLLEAKFWNSSAQNPFSPLPRKVVEDLEVFIRSKLGISENKKTYENLQLLYESGHIVKFDVFHWNSKKNQMWLLDILTENFCKNLISLSLPKHFYATYPVESILSSCSKLVEVHLPVFVDLNVFENCPKLEILKFHASDDEISRYFRKITGDLPLTIRKLQVFSMCNIQSHYAVTKDIIAKLLLNCPKLVSVGCCNSLDAFQYIRETQEDLPTPFHLRRCYWGFKYCCFIPTTNTPNFESCQPLFSRMVKMASLMCSSLEELVIDVYDNNCVQHLVKLKNLKFLSISYEDPYDDNYQPAFVSLLREIGSQLKHLSVSAQSPIPVDIIWKSCSNLVTLRLLGEVIVSDSEKKWENLSHLKSLCVDKIRKENLQLLLQTCPNMKELFIDNIDLTDEFLEILLKQDAIPKLEVVSVGQCRLTETGIITFLRFVPTLRKVSFALIPFPPFPYQHENPTEAIIEWIESFGKNIEVDERLHKKEYFRVKTHPCVF